MGIIQELFYNTKFEFHKQMSREGTECISVQVRSEERPRGSRSVPCPPSPRALYTCPCLGGVGREDGEAERWECIWEDKHSCWRILSIELDYHFRNDCNAWKTLKLEDDRIASHFNPPPSRQSNGVLQVRQEAKREQKRESDSDRTSQFTTSGRSEHLFNDGKSVNFSTLDVWEAKLTQVWMSLAVFINTEHFYSLDRIDNRWFMISELKLCCFPYDCDMICFLCASGSQGGVPLLIYQLHVALLRSVCTSPIPAVEAPEAPRLCAFTSFQL